MTESFRGDFLALGNTLTKTKRALKVFLKNQIQLAFHFKNLNMIPYSRFLLF